MKKNQTNEDLRADYLALLNLMMWVSRYKPNYRDDSGFDDNQDGYLLQNDLSC